MINLVRQVCGYKYVVERTDVSEFYMLFVRGCELNNCQVQLNKISFLYMYLIGFIFVDIQ